MRIIGLLSLIGLGLVLTAAAYAQTIHLKTNVPFSFIVGRTMFPAGQYEVQSTGNGDFVLVIRGLSSGPQALVLSNSCESREPSPRTTLIFHRYGQRYFLSEVWMRGNSIGRRTLTSSREIEIAKDSSMEKVVLLASGK